MELVRCDESANDVGFMDSQNPQPLSGDPRRRANATIAAFDYQLWQTLLAWSRLQEGMLLYVEGAEDFDVTEGNLAAC